MADDAFTYEGSDGEGGETCDPPAEVENLTKSWVSVALLVLETAGVAVAGAYTAGVVRVALVVIVVVLLLVTLWSLIILVTLQGVVGLAGRVRRRG